MTDSVLGFCQRVQLGRQAFVEVSHCYRAIEVQPDEAFALSGAQPPVCPAFLSTE